MRVESFIAYVFLFFLSLGISGSAMATEQNERSPKLTFDEVEHDYGDIEERGGRVRHEFNFVNTGDVPLLITRSIFSCKCITVNFSKRPVMPGDSASITVTFNPRKQYGMFYKAIQIYSNAPERVHVLIVKGRVTVEE